MTYALSNAFYFHSGEEVSERLQRKSDRVTALFDSILIAAAVVSCRSMMLGAGSCILIGDLIAGVWKWRCEESITDKYHRIISAAKEPPCHQILPGLFIGDQQAFAETTHESGPVERYDWFTGTNTTVDTTNPRGFTAVVTVCPLEHIFDGMGGIIDQTIEGLAKNFSTHGIGWYYVGYGVGDSPKSWSKLVSACSGGEVPQDVSKWFAPVFSAFDRAVYSNEKVLVHCFAGVSRSTTLVAAYLIYRFDVTSVQALNFIRMQRKFADSKFKKELQEYEVNLRPSCNFPLNS